MLDSHPELSIPGECHVLYKIARQRSLGLWPRPRSPRWAEAFLQSALSDPHMKAWNLQPDPLRSRVEALPDQGLGELFRALYDEYLAGTGKARWGDKTPMHVQYMWILDAFFPRARFIHVIRDARDVVQSALKKPWGPRHISHGGLYWKWLVLSGMFTGRILGPERYLEIRFEDLLVDPESTLRKATAFAGLEYTDQLLRYHEGESARAYAEAGDQGSSRLFSPIQRDRLYKWRESMSGPHQKSILRQAGAVLALNGYDCDGMPDSEKRDLERLQELLSGEAPKRIELAASPRKGSEIGLQLGLQFDRLKMARAFFARDWEAWSRTGIRWQRTVTSLLE